MATEEIDRQLEQLKRQKGVKVVFVLNWEGEMITSLVNDKTLNEGMVEAYYILAFHVCSGLRSAVKSFDTTTSTNETLQYGRVRMKDTEVIIVPEEKFMLAVIQDPNAT